MKTKEEVFSGVKLPGIPMLLLNLLFLVGIVVLFVWAVGAPELSSGLRPVVIISSIILFIMNMIFWGGFMQIEPNEARVMIFFGKYEGTVKDNGFFWVNPFYNKSKLTLRARNLDAAPIKVNDKNGNPVMIGMVVVWRLADTYKAAFNVDTGTQTLPNSGNATVNLANFVTQKMNAYENFVKVQSDAALRNVAGLYAYDQSGTEKEDELTLRSGGEHVNDFLETQLSERIAIAGIEVIEARINYLAYAPEIAAVMLRRQQADAIISAREKIVEGAVGMVKMALTKLSDEAIVDLDEDKKAAMVSNLLVVLCSDENAQPVLNAGTLHQ